MFRSIRIETPILIGLIPVSRPYFNGLDRQARLMIDCQEDLREPSPSKRRTVAAGVFQRPGEIMPSQDHDNQD